MSLASCCGKKKNKKIDDQIRVDNRNTASSHISAGNYVLIITDTLDLIAPINVANSRQWTYDHEKSNKSYTIYFFVKRLPAVPPVSSTISSITLNFVTSSFPAGSQMKPRARRFGERCVKQIPEWYDPITRHPPMSIYLNLKVWWWGVNSVNTVNEPNS